MKRGGELSGCSWQGGGWCRQRWPLASGVAAEVLQAARPVATAAAQAARSLVVSELTREHSATAAAAE